jgi:hypothetical protein
LIGLCLGLAASVAWKALQAVAGDPVEGPDAFDRAKFAIRAVVYATVLAAAITVLLANIGASSSPADATTSQGDTKEQAAATVLDWPAGQFLVVVAGLAIIGFGVYEFVLHAVRGEFLDRLDLSPLSEDAAHAVEVVGRLGYAATALTTMIVGGFFVSTGWQHDPQDAKGLSGALTELGDSAWGQVLLWGIAAGLFLFAAFSLLEARLRRST